MWRRTGMLVSLMLMSMMLWTGTVTAQDDISVFNYGKTRLDQKYGIEIHAGGATYLMGDINDYRAAGNHLSNDEDAAFGIAWGVGILIRNHEHFRWTFTYSKLGEDRTYASWTAGTVEEIEQTVSGSELYLGGMYLAPVTDHFHLYVGAGPTIVSGSMDRSATSDQPFYDATGRDVGFRVDLGGELLFSETLALNLDLGFRYAKIKRLTYEDRQGEPEVVYWSGNRQFQLDFTGVFVEVGLRIYFKPATSWLDI